jgi:hypothetical protein
VEKFWEALSGKLADRWATICVPALAFWLGGLLAWVASRRGFAALREPVDWFSAQAAPVQIALAAVGLLAVAASGIVVERLTVPALRLVEGYWPAWLEPVRWRLADRFARRAEAVEDAFQKLAGPVIDGTATAEQKAEHVRLTHAWRQLPGPGRYQPTKVGNILRAAESRPVDKYGLDAVALWPHLWLLLPDTTRKELADSRAALNTTVNAGVWSLLFPLFTAWTPWALPAGLGVAALAYLFWIPARAEVYANLVEAAFDLYRDLLYRELRWPLPENPQDEQASGRLVTAYLVRGLSGKSPTFTAPP